MFSGSWSKASSKEYGGLGKDMVVWYLPCEVARFKKGIFIKLTAYLRCPN